MTTSRRSWYQSVGRDTKTVSGKQCEFVSSEYENGLSARMLSSAIN